jgi:hypothetical protein
MFGIEAHAHEMMRGHCVTVAALVIALDECGVVPRSRYNEALHRLWREMPEEEAVGEAGAVIEQVLDLLETDGDLHGNSDGAEPGQHIRDFTRKAVNDDIHAKLARASLEALLPV